MINLCLCIINAIFFVNGIGTSEGPLILTPLIKQGKIKEARNAAEVKFGEFLNVKSYAGYFTVNENYHSNSFFWFFPSQTNYANAPVVLWIEGGPGGSTLFDVFVGNGPFEIITNSHIEMGKDAWIRNQSIIYLDNPVGTGYSFTDEGGYAKNETIIGAQLYEAVLQFFQLFPELQKNNFFIGGTSYAGKYVPAVSYTIHKNNPFAKQTINLKGMAIGNGLSDPEHQLSYSEYLYQIGLIDSAGRNKMEDMEKDLTMYIKNEEWQKAIEKFDLLIFDNNSLYNNLTGFENFHSYVLPKANFTWFDMYPSYLQRKDVRTALHVGNTAYYWFNDKVFQNLRKDIVQSVAPWISELLSHYKVLFYNGQLDVICAYPLTVNFIKNLNFSGALDYETAHRHKWYVGTDLAGYVKEAGNLTEILVRNASHGAQVDQPKWIFDLMTRFTHGLPFY